MSTKVYRPQSVLCDDENCDMCSIYIYYTVLSRRPYLMGYVAELAIDVSGHYLVERDDMSFEALYHAKPLHILAYDERSYLRSFRIAN